MVICVLPVPHGCATSAPEVPERCEIGVGARAPGALAGNKVGIAEFVVGLDTVISGRDSEGFLDCRVVHYSRLSLPSPGKSSDFCGDSDILVPEHMTMLRSSRAEGHRDLFLCKILTPSQKTRRAAHCSIYLW